MIGIRPEDLLPQTASGQESRRNNDNDIKIPCSVLRIVAVPCAIWLIMIGLLLIRGGV